MFARFVFAANLLFAAATTAVASAYQRPVPQPQSESVELWYACASLLFCVALFVVHRMVKRR